MWYAALHYSQGAGWLTVGVTGRGEVTVAFGGIAGVVWRLHRPGYKDTNSKED